MTVSNPGHMSDHRIDRLCHKTYEHRDARIIRTLGSVYPKSITAKQLMIRSGFKFHVDPVSSFVSLCVSFSKINQVLSGTGWQAIRTGGTPDDNYRLSPTGG